MRILHLRASNFYGGPERQIHLHAVTARTSPYRVSLGSFPEAKKTPAFITAARTDGIDTRVFPVSSSYDLSVTAAIKGYIGRNGIDLVCSHEYRTAVLCFLLSRGGGVRWCAFSRGSTRENVRTASFHLVEKALIRFAHRIVAVSNGERRRLRRYLIPETRVVVVENAVDPSLIASAPRKDIRRRLGFAPDSVVCVCAGRFSAEKGQVHLVEAARTVAARDGRLRVVMFGDGPDLPRIRKKIRDAGLEHTIICPGYESSLSSYLRDCDILVNPSLSEGMPNVVLEAMALEVPAVATAVGGVPELVEDGHTGRLVAPGSGQSLARGIMELAHNPRLRRSMGKAARKRIEGKFTSGAQFTKLCGVYDSAVIDGKRAGKRVCPGEGGNDADSYYRRARGKTNRRSRGHGTDFAHGDRCQGGNRSKCTRAVRDRRVHLEPDTRQAG